MRLDSTADRTAAFMPIDLAINHAGEIHIRDMIR